MDIDYFKKYFTNFPITGFLILVNLLIFLLNRSGVVPIVSTPGIINYQAFLASFSHYDLIHFGFNMFVLWQISPLIEVKFRGILYVGIILAIWSIVTLGIVRFSEYPTLGFSGIALGMMVLAGFLYWRNKYISKQLLGWAAANIFIGLLPGISFIGHFIGALAGAVVFGVIYLTMPREKKLF